MSVKPKGVVHFYNGRCTAEQWIKEGKYALNRTRLSCKRFVSNQVRLGWDISLFIKHIRSKIERLACRKYLPKELGKGNIRLSIGKLFTEGEIVRNSNLHS